MVELTSAEAGPHERDRVFTVSEITSDIKKRLEQIGMVWVSGEISNLRRPPSGHRYFTLKDAHSQINAVLFAGMAARIRETVENGIQVRVQGRVGVYPPNGSYQIIVQELKREGKGSLQEQFDRLRAQLESEGLFEAARKRPLPLLPRCVAVVTSPTGAVIRDMLNIFDRRFGAVNAVLVPVKVQGEGAALEVAAAIALLNTRRAEIEKLTGAPIDLIITGRGGGSLEDLWAFNEEGVARAIVASAIPVVSAVGHETDTTISDYVADRRASTPSVAAELVMPVRADLIATLERQGRRLTLALQRRYAVLRTHLDGLARRPCLRIPEQPIRERQQRLDEWALRLPRALIQRIGHVRTWMRSLADRPVLQRPQAIVEDRREPLPDLGLRLARGLLTQLSAARARMDALAGRPVLQRPLEFVRERRDPLPEWGMRLARASAQGLAEGRSALERWGDRLGAAPQSRLRPLRERLDGLRALLEGLNPHRVLARGYTLTKRSPDGRVVGSVSEVKPGDHLRIVFQDGAARVWVEGIDTTPGE